MVTYRVLEPEDFCREQSKAHAKVTVPTDEAKEHFRDQVFALQGQIVDALKRTWKEFDDFEVGWDFDYCYFVCGGIYSEAAFCKAYVDTIAETRAKADPDGKWTHHTVCEILVNPDGKTIGECVEFRGQFFIRGGVCFIDGSMTPQHRMRIGCEI